MKKLLKKPCFEIEKTYFLCSSFLVAPLGLHFKDDL
jgi:hypothetical protein